MNSSVEYCCQACGQNLTTGIQQSAPPNRRLRRTARKSCHPSVNSNLLVDSSSNDRLCSDCLDAIKLAALMDDSDDENDDDVDMPTPAGETEADVTIVPHDTLAKPSTQHPNHTVTKSMSTASRIVSPECQKSRQLMSGGSKLCSICNVRAVPEEYMEYCKRCYAQSSKGTKSKPLDATFDKTAATSTNQKIARCRLCTGVVSNSAHQYCLKCYTAKQRDDSRRIQGELYQNLFKKQPIQQHIPYICMDCGGTIRDCSWKTKCPPCFEKFRVSIQGRPKLVKPLVRRPIQRKRKYRS